MNGCNLDWCAGPDSNMQEQELCRRCDGINREKRKRERAEAKERRKEWEQEMKLGGIAIVCGGRNLRDRNLVFRILDWFKPSLVVHGGAPGADSLAQEWSERRGVPAAVYPADWEKHGKAAGPIRNERMVSENASGAVIAFPGGKGTASTVGFAHQYRVPVITVAANGGRAATTHRCTAQSFTETADYSKFNPEKL